MTRVFRLQSENQLAAIKRRMRGEDKPGAALAKADALYRREGQPAPDLVVEANLSKSASKYHNERTDDGYDSKRESRRAQALRLLQQAGEISDLREQVRFELIPAQYDADGNLLEKSCAYIADFCYVDARGRNVVEDSKGHATEVFNIKRKLMLWRHGVRIQCV